MISVFTKSSLRSAALLGLLFSGSVWAQQPPKAPDAPSPRTKPSVVVSVKAPVVVVGGETTERSIGVGRGVSVALCVIEGEVRVNGWDRDEVRSLVVGGNQKLVSAPANRNEKPTSVEIQGVLPDPKMKAEPCVSGSQIEIDVPRDATVTIRGRSDRTRVESVARVKVETVSGDITLRDVTAGVAATTYEGTVFAERLKGSVALSGDSIVAVDVSPAATGDSFSARTGSGLITLQSILHRSVVVNTITGGIVYRGNVATDGQYQFSSQSGRVLVTVPAGIICKVAAWQGVGTFTSSIPLQNIVRTGPSTTGQFGTGSPICAMMLKTTSGQLRIVTEK